MRHLAFPSALLSAALSAPAALALPVPPLDHVVVVVMENKSYDETRVQPFTASFMSQGATFTNSFAVAHPSQPNYLAMWGGNTMVTNDNCPPAGAPYALPNLGQACEAAGKSWRSYSENLAVAGSAACSYDGNTSTGLYTRKHCPWVDYSNLNHANERTFADLTADLAAGNLPNLAYVIPNNCHNSHNSSTAGCSLVDADNWLSTILPSLVAAVGPNGVVVLTWDEDDSSSSNHILTVFVGPPVLPGVSSAQRITHYTVLRTIGDALGLPPVGAAVSELPITSVWYSPTAATRETWGALKIRYR